MDPFVELTTLVDALEGAAVDYALCGAVALAVHGAPRATQDIDVLVRPINVERVRTIARAIGFTLESHPMKFSSGFTVHRLVKLIDTQPFIWTSSRPRRHSRWIFDEPAESDWQTEPCALCLEKDSSR